MTQVVDLWEKSNSVYTWKLQKRRSLVPDLLFYQLVPLKWDWVKEKYKIMIYGNYLIFYVHMIVLLGLAVLGYLPNSKRGPERSSGKIFCIIFL